MKITVKKGDLWGKLKLQKRSQYNPIYNKTKSQMRFNSKLHVPSFVKHPKYVTLDQSILFIERGPGGETTVYFREDVSEEEINRVTEIVKSET